MSSDRPILLDRLSSSASESRKKGKANRNRRELPSWILPVALLAGFALVFALLFGKRLLPALPVEVAPVITIRSEITAGTPESSLSNSQPATAPKTMLFQASGWIEPDPFIISVPTLVGGIVKEVFVLEGESVRKGQKLATLIDDDARLDLDEVESRAATLKSEIAAQKSRGPLVESKRTGIEKKIASRKIKLEELQDRLDRLGSLPRGSIPQIDLASAKLQAEQQQALVEEAAAEIPELDSELKVIGHEIETKNNLLREAEVAVAKAKLALARHVIHAPMDGIVLHLHAAPGAKRMVHMDHPKSAYIIEMFDPEKLQARIDVPLSEASALSVGQPVEMVTDLLNNLDLKGRVSRITGEADLQRNTLQVKVSIENPDSRLRPEMLVRGKFYAIPRRVAPSSGSPVTGGAIRRRLSIFVPQRAVFGGDQVWVARPDLTAELRRLSLGAESREDHRLVVGGLRSGEKVVVPPFPKLKSGKRIKFKKP